MNRIYRSELCPGSVKKALRSIRLVKNTLAGSSKSVDLHMIRSRLAVTGARRDQHLSKFLGYIIGMEGVDHRSMPQLYVESKGRFRRHRFRSRSVRVFYRRIFRYVALFE